MKAVRLLHHKAASYWSPTLLNTQLVEATAAEAVALAFRDLVHYSVKVKLSAFLVVAK